ncbi:MAG: hypothetical protein Kow0037_25190 [Calditrichia bacterium]
MIIDGHNLLKAANSRIPSLGIYEEELAHLVRLIRSWQASRRIPVTIVFDGNRPGHPDLANSRGVQLRFSGTGKTADEVIQQIVRSARRPEKYQVVTSDRDIQFTARDHGAQVCSSASFWERMRSNQPNGALKEEKPDGVSSSTELQEWINLFKQNRNGDDEAI